MSSSFGLLCITAASIGFFHTIFGPDHYLPFVVMKKARGWSLLKTTFITFLCGLGHVLSSVLLGIIGVIFGIALMKLEAFEAFRGNLAAWALIGFGFAYFLWGMRMAFRQKSHDHKHLHDDEKEHSHHHTHIGIHGHVHASSKKNITPWVLFTIFVLGPCEPLIPILMYPAAKMSFSGMAIVALIFSVVTIATMLSVVIVTSLGIHLIPLRQAERFSHALAGATIFLSGMAIQFLGL